MKHKIGENLIAVLAGMGTVFLVAIGLLLITHRTIEVQGPRVPDKEYKIIVGEVTAYSPRPEETDDTPTINAMGLKVQEGDIANNCLPFKTKVEIQGEIYVVRDRMNRRYGCEHFDLFIWDTHEAIEFGRRTIEIKIIK